MKSILFVLIIILDHLIKLLITNNILKNSFQEILPFFDLVNIQNQGISFGLFAGTIPSWIILIIVTAIIFILIVWFIRTYDKFEEWGLTCVIAGGISNFFDRLLNKHVVDYLFFHYNQYYWPAFNVADLAITVGIGLLLIAAYKRHKYRIKVNNE